MKINAHGDQTGKLFFFSFTFSKEIRCQTGGWDRVQVDLFMTDMFNLNTRYAAMLKDTII